MRVTGDRVHDRAQKLFAEMHHLVHVGIRQVKFKHREFRVVLGRDALIAEVAVQLIDFFKAAYDQPLQIKFRGDARVKIDVQRVVMRLERTRGGARGERRQHRRLDFDVAMLVEKASNLAHYFRAQLENFARCQITFIAFKFQTAGDQIGVALTLPNLRIVYAMHFVRHRQ